MKALKVCVDLLLTALSLILIAGGIWLADTREVVPAAAIVAIIAGSAWLLFFALVGRGLSVLPEDKQDN
jgi:hypothetical protein